MTIETVRHKLPLLAVGQAQKEYTHNEALLLIDNLINLSITSILENPDMIEDAENLSDESKTWLISDMPSGIWAQRANQIATLSDNGFRYIAPIEGMTLYNESEKSTMIYKDMAWYFALTLEKPTGGSIVDAEARESIMAIVDNLRQFGLSRNRT